MTGSLLHLASLRLASISQALLDNRQDQNAHIPQDEDLPHDEAARQGRAVISLPADVVRYFGRHVAVVVDGPAGADAFFVFTSAKTSGRYACRGVLHDDSIEAYVEEAYRLVLGRPTDHQGREIYCGSLRDGALTRLDALVHMACSGEARQNGRNILIVPRTSAWLAGLGRDLSTCTLILEGGGPR